jgi:hypothetical protein
MWRRDATTVTAHRRSERILSRSRRSGLPGAGHHGLISREPHASDKRASEISAKARLPIEGLPIAMLDWGQTVAFWKAIGYDNYDNKEKHPHG